jgi:hypothetical protein
VKVHNWQALNLFFFTHEKKILLTNLILDTRNLNLDMKFQNLEKREVEERSFEKGNNSKNYT